ncbi:MAG TPA: GAF domain-containing protein [Candidatus Didemnitutus sp.]|nr:GAF domain-containing protein [Candidatus Didemnitutus sp.]
MSSVAHRDLAVLHRIAALTAGDGTAMAAERAVLEAIVSVIPANSASLSLLNPHTGYLEIVTQLGLPSDTGDFALKLGQGITGWVALHGRPVLVPDVASEPRYIAARATVQCEMAAPLVARGQVVGVINLDEDRPHAFGDEDLRRLVSFADEASRTLHRLWQLERLQNESAQLETLVNLGHSLVARLEEGDLLATLTRSGRELFDARLCTLHACDPAQAVFELQAWSSEVSFSETALRREPFNADESFLASALRNSRVVEFQSLDTTGAQDAVDLPADPTLCSALAAPLLVDGAPAGVLAVYTARPHRFSDAQKRLLAALASFAAVALHNSRLYARVFQSEEILRKNQTLTTLGLLAAEIAHEIRNPLTVIKLLHGPLGADFAPDDLRRRDLQVITEKIEQLEDIVARVLSFGRAPAALHSRWPLGAMIEDTLHLLRAKLAQAGVQLRYSGPARPVYVEANKGQVQQVFLNLAINALQAMPHGGKLYITCAIGEGTVSIDFADTGGGIPAELQPRIFESFLSGRADGTGLGLTIARRIVKDHRGELSLVGTGPEGTTMRVTLPLAP